MAIFNGSQATLMVDDTPLGGIVSMTISMEDYPFHGHVDGDIVTMRQGTSRYVIDVSCRGTDDPGQHAMWEAVNSRGLVLIRHTPNEGGSSFEFYALVTAAGSDGPSDVYFRIESVLSDGGVSVTVKDEPSTRVSRFTVMPDFKPCVFCGQPCSTVRLAYRVHMRCDCVSYPSSRMGPNKQWKFSHMDMNRHDVRSTTRLFIAGIVEVAKTGDMEKLKEWNKKGEAINMAIRMKEGGRA